MHFTDTAIILSVRRLSEHGGIVRVLTRENGLHAGVDRFAFSSKRRALYQSGNRVQVAWRARLSEQLGTFTTELLEPIAAYALDDRIKLAALQSACQLCDALLNEREPQPEVWEAMERMVSSFPESRSDSRGIHREVDLGGEVDGPIVSFANSGHDELLTSYVLLELTLLKTAGFGLDLASCAATGMREGLAYVSPKSGRAVCAAAGEAYKEKLFRLPGFLLSPLPLAGGGRWRVSGHPHPASPAGGGGETTPHPTLSPKGRGINMADLLDALRLCGYFLETRALAAKQGKLPQARERMMRALELRSAQPSTLRRREVWA